MPCKIPVHLLLPYFIRSATKEAKQFRQVGLYIVNYGIHVYIYVSYCTYTVASETENLENLSLLLFSLSTFLTCM